MLFPTPSFALFFLAVFALGWGVFSGRTSWRYFMLFASYAFYGLFGLQSLGILVAISLVGWAASVAIGAIGPRRPWSRFVLILALAVDVGALVYFKLGGPLQIAAERVMGVVGASPVLEITQIVMPVGLSYLMFRMISSVVDVYRGDAIAPSLIDFALYSAFFPYIASGPIVRLNEVVGQWVDRHPANRVRSTQGFALIATGLVKKMLVADYLARVAVDNVFETPAAYGSADVVSAVLAYSAQIYCDFSGYVDMAIGVALLLGIVLPPNFEAPYTAKSLREFWRRWHMTLSRFLRDYIYIPLGGSRRGLGRHVFAIMATMVIAGVWHGTGWTFVLWGAAHGIVQVGEALARKNRPRVEAAGVVRSALTWGLTFGFVTLAWIPFRADSLATAWDVFSGMFTRWSVSPTLPPAVWLLSLLVVAVQFVPASARQLIKDTFWSRSVITQAAGLSAVLYAVAVIAPEGPTAFIYGGF